MRVQACGFSRVEKGSLPDVIDALEIDLCSSDGKYSKLRQVSCARLVQLRISNNA